jgi:hypothetical protein
LSGGIPDIGVSAIGGVVQEFDGGIGTCGVRRRAGDKKEK